MRRSHLAHKGMTLLEVLISVVILAFGMLGLAGMLMVASKANSSSYLKQIAVQSIYNMFDKIRANSTAAVNGYYTISNIGSNGSPTAVSTPSVLCNTAVCNTTQLATYDTWLWLTRTVAQLPQGSGSIATAPSLVSGNTTVTITVQWDDSPAQTLVGANSSIAPTNAHFVQLVIQSEL